MKFALVIIPHRVLAGPIYQDSRGQWRFVFSDEPLNTYARECVTIFNY